MLQRFFTHGLLITVTQVYMFATILVVLSKSKCNKRLSLSERCRRSRCVARGCLHLSERKKKQPAIQIKKETKVSQRLTNSVLQMYHQLILEQRSQIFALLQKKTARKDIADIVGIKQCVQTFLQHIQEL